MSACPVTDGQNDTGKKSDLVGCLEDIIPTQ